MSVTVEAIKDDITTREVDAIINAAHTGLTGGGGVDGAIHHAAGPRLLGECLNLYGCREGEARITSGYDIPAKYVIHTVGPVWTPKEEDQEKAKETLAKCYESCLELAERQGLKSIAFPCISTGAYCFPKELAAEISIKTICDWLDSYIHNIKNEYGCYLETIEIICFTDEDLEICKQAIENEEKARIHPKCDKIPKSLICSSLIGDECWHSGKCWMKDDSKE